MVGIILVSVARVLDISVIIIYIIDTRCKERGKEGEDETSKVTCRSVGVYYRVQ